MRHTFIDTGADIVEVPWANVEGQKKMADGSWRFRLVGGPYHGMVIRVYPPCDRIEFPKETGTLTYEIHPPLARNEKWVYVYNPNP